MRQPAAEWQACITRETPDLPTGDGCFADGAVGEAEDDQEDHHVHGMPILDSAHEDAEKSIAIVVVSICKRSFRVTNAEYERHGHEEAKTAVQTDRAQYGFGKIARSIMNLLSHMNTAIVPDPDTDGCCKPDHRREAVSWPASKIGEL